MWVSALARRTPKDRRPGNHVAAGPFGVRIGRGFATAVGSLLAGP
jgi:hypothetical protein